MAEDDAGSVRSQIAGSLTGWATPEQTFELVNMVLAIKKRASAEFSCKSCGQRQMQWVEIPDAAAVAKALKDLLAEGFGRPQGEESGDRIVFQRLVELPEEAADE